LLKGMEVIIRTFIWLVLFLFYYF